MASTVSSDLGKSVRSDRSDIIYLKEKRERGKEKKMSAGCSWSSHKTKTKTRSVARVAFPASFVSHSVLVSKEKKILSRYIPIWANDTPKKAKLYISKFSDPSLEVLRFCLLAPIAEALVLSHFGARTQGCITEIWCLLSPLQLYKLLVDIQSGASKMRHKKQKLRITR